jgi:hypothetical protein
MFRQALLLFKGGHDCGSCCALKGHVLRGSLFWCGCLFGGETFTLNLCVPLLQRVPILTDGFNVVVQIHRMLLGAFWELQLEVDSVDQTFSLKYSCADVFKNWKKLPEVRF